jgi:hypothetical protein
MAVAAWGVAEPPTAARAAHCYHADPQADLYRVLPQLRQRAAICRANV